MDSLIALKKDFTPQELNIFTIEYEKRIKV
jgi:hypothetical protein